MNGEKVRACDRNRTVARRKRRLCSGSRLWIFLVLGALVEVLGLVVGGIYLNVRSLTSSLENTEILPTYVVVAAVLLAGLLVLLLFWKRLHLLVFLSSVISVGVGLLCGGIAVLMGTHILRPMMHFTQCLQSRGQCQCLSPFSRQQLSVGYSEEELTSYVYNAVSQCNIIQHDLLHMLTALCVVYAIVFLTCMVVAVLAVLAYRTELLQKRALESDSYEEIYTVSNSSSSPTDADPDTEQQSLQLLRSASCRPAGPQDRHIVATTDFIYSPSDIPLDYNEACRMRQRSHSFSQLCTQAHSQDNNQSTTAYASSTLGRADSRRQGQGEGQGQGRLKENRRRARRAVTLANLDHQQLMLIMSLQLRYLQENEADRQFQANNVKLEKQTRRALTPTPRQERSSRSNVPADVDTRPVKLLRSHTPQPNPTYQMMCTSPTSTSTFEKSHLGQLVDYENVDKCVTAIPARKGLSAARQLGKVESSVQRGPACSRTSPSVGAQKTPKTLPSTSSLESMSSSIRSMSGSRTGSTCGFLSLTQGDDGYVVMQGNIKSSVQGNIKSSDQGNPKVARTNSYENVDNMSSSGVPSTAHREPLYENQKEPLAVKRLRKRTSNPKHQLDSALLHHQHQHSRPPQKLADVDHPARPKSYINAVEGVESSTHSEDSEKEEQISVRSSSKNSQLMSHFPADNVTTSASSIPSTTASLEGQLGWRDVSLCQEIYALPQKKAERPLPPRPLVEGQSSRNSTLPMLEEEDDRKSAFHKVCRPPHLQSTGDTDQDDLQPLPCPSFWKKSSKVPPYSSPPSYDCLVSSRNGSLHSLVSNSSHTTTEDIEPELYKQIRKKRGGEGSTVHSSASNSPYNGSSQHLNERQGSLHSNSPYNGSSQHLNAGQGSLHSNSPYNGSSRQLNAGQGSLHSNSPYNGSSQQLNAGQGSLYSNSPYNGSSQQLNAGQGSLHSNSPYNGSSQHLNAGQGSLHSNSPYNGSSRQLNAGQGSLHSNSPYNGSSRHLNAGQGSLHSNAFMPGRLHTDGKVGTTQGHQYSSGWEGYYCNRDQFGIHSFPFRKHHPPSASAQLSPPRSLAHPQPAGHDGPLIRPALLRSYDDLDDDVFDQPASLGWVDGGQRSCHGLEVSAAQHVDVNSNRMSYEDILQLNAEQDADSESEFMETVI